MSRASYRSSPADLGDGDQGDVLLDVKGRQIVAAVGVAGGTPQPTDITKVGGIAVAAGQAAMAASVPVAIASDQSAVPVAGNAASGAADSGNPVKVAGRFNTTQPTVTDAQRIDWQMTNRGEGKVALYSGAQNLMVQNDTSLNGQNASAALLTIANRPFLYNGATYDRLYAPNIFKSVQATASGDTAVWTPTAGKKFRLQRFKIVVPANAAISGGGVVLTVKLRDSTTDMTVTHDVFIPQTAVTTTVGGFVSGWIDLGNGILSAVANNVLNVNLSSTLTTGNVRVIACGVEE